jgi:hypothetical protein
MPPNTKLKRISLSTKRRRDSTNVRRDTRLVHTGPSGFCACFSALILYGRGLYIPLSHRETSPAILRIVSGRNTKMTRMVRDERINRNTKIDLKPRKSARRPPITGPIAMLKFRTTREIELSVPDSGGHCIKEDRKDDGLTSLVEADESTPLSRR